MIIHPGQYDYELIRVAETSGSQDSADRPEAIWRRNL